MEATEVVHARGHENILATHTTTFEITKKSSVTKRGNCIIAVGATKSAADLHPRFKEIARSESARIAITIEADSIVDFVEAEGAQRLLPLHPTDMVIRISDYACGRTVAIRADKAAADLSRKLIEKLRSPMQSVKITLRAES
jgi:hypothetical protein